MKKGFKLFKMNYFKYLSIYTILFLLFFLSIFYVFFLENRTFVWRSDGMGQYILNLYYLYTNIIDAVKNFFISKKLTIPFFSFDVGIGNDILSMYFSGILEYFGIFLKRSNIVFTYNLITVLKIYLSGLSFLLLCKYFRQKPIESIIGAMIYVFSGYTLYYGIRHPQFITPMILLPLFIISVNRLIKKEKVGLFIFLVFYSAWVDYYFLYINSLLFGIYFLLLNLLERVRIKEFISNTIRLLFNYFLGISIAAIPFISKVSDFINSPRTTSTVSIDKLFFYKDNWILKFLSRIFSPYINPDYLDHYMLYSVLSIVFISSIALFFFNEKKNRILKILFFLTLLFFMFPIIGFIFSGFSSVINRWSYAFLLVVSYIFVVVFPRLNELNKKHWIIILIIAFLFCIFSSIEYRIYGNKSTLIGIICLCVVVIFVFFIYMMKIKNKIIIYFLITFIILSNATCMSTYLFSENYGKVASEFLAVDEFNKIIDNSLDNATTKIKDSDFFRTELYTNYQHQAGLSKYFRYNGTAIYDSTNDANIIDYNRSIENIGNLTVGNYYNYDGRSFLESLACVKYFIAPEYASQYVPYGFSFYDSVQQKESVNNIYVNENTLPIAFTFDNVISTDLYKNLTAIQKQEVMLQGMYIDKYDGKVAEMKDPLITSEELKYRIVSKDADFLNNKIVAHNDNAVLRFEFNAINNSETYLNIEDLKIDSVSDDSFSILVQSDDGVQKGIWAMTNDDFYKFEKNNYLINLGYSESGKTYCELILPYAGEYSFDSIKIFSQKVDNLSDYINKLKANDLKNIDFRNNCIEGDITLESNKILCFSIPFSPDWELFVDGVRTSTYKGNEMFLSADIESGNHHIELRYSPKALKLGVPLMILSLSFIFFRYLYHSRFKDNRKGSDRAQKKIEI